MKALLLVVTCLVISSCAARAPSGHADVVSNATAIDRATQEVRRRGWRLPLRYTAKAERVEVSQLGSPSIPIFSVTFYGPARGGKRVWLYGVEIDRASGAITESTDLRLLEPPRDSIPDAHHLRIREQEAIARARTEVQRRGWGLAAGYTVRTTKRFMIYGTGPVVPIVSVTFYSAASGGGKRALLYEVAVDRASGAVEYAFDFRRDADESTPTT